MTPQPPLLNVVIRERRLQRYGVFTAEYEKTAIRLDPDLRGTAPSRAQLHRWTSGAMKRLPYVDHCRVLEAMFPEWTAEELFGPCPPDMTTASESPAEDSTSDAQARGQVNGVPTVSSHKDVIAVFPSRAEFSAAHPAHVLFDGAQSIRAAGLSLNIICQQYPDQRLYQLLEGGACIQTLFLDPEGQAIRERENEEGYTDNHLTTLGRLNIELLKRVRSRLSPEASERFAIRVYDEVIRFNITLINHRLCVMQPYLPQARGVDSPTFVMDKEVSDEGLYGTFEEIYTSLWERGKNV